MKCIKVITDLDFDLKPKEFNNPRKRYSARGIIVNNNNEIAILYKSQKNEYKLIGGGIKDDENLSEAFEREALEETGTIIRIKECLGITREEKSQDNFIQISYIYIANVLEDTKKLHLTEKEKKEGSIVLWLEPFKALKLIKESESILKSSKYEGKLSIYHTKFIVRRDYEILKYYIENYIK